MENSHGYFRLSFAKQRCHGYFVKNRSERYSAQHTSLANTAQLVLVVSLHANQAATEYRASGR